jgi:hypothetical protein
MVSLHSERGLNSYPHAYASVFRIVKPISCIAKSRLPFSICVNNEAAERISGHTS